MIVDVGHSRTDDIIAEIEKRVGEEYAQAAREVDEKFKDYMRRFEKKKQIKLISRRSDNTATVQRMVLWAGLCWETMAGNEGSIGNGSDEQESDCQIHYSRLHARGLRFKPQFCHISV